MTPEPLAAPAPQPAVEGSPDDEDASAPSEIELEAFQIVRAILRPLVKPARISIRAAASYCAILFDDNNRKPICRLRFNNENRLVIGLFNGSKEEERVPIASVDQIFDFDDRLKSCVGAYVKADPSKENAGDIAAV